MKTINKPKHCTSCRLLRKKKKIHAGSVNPAAASSGVEQRWRGFAGVYTLFGRGAH